MSGDMSERMSERVSEEMSESMPEDLSERISSTPEAGPAPGTPEWLRRPNTVQQRHSGSNCPVCLCTVDPAGQGPESCFQWPVCDHQLHLGCMAHLLTHYDRPSCPACRNPWAPESEDQLNEQCRQQGYLRPQPPHTLPSRVSTPTAEITAAPPPPEHTVILCCPRLLLIDPANAELDEAWQELPDFRHLAWAPVHQPSTNTWHPEWVCLRCNATISPQHDLFQNLPPRPTCSQHGPRTFVIDLPRRERGWACIRSHSHVLPCPTVPIPIASEAGLPNPPTSNPRPSDRRDALQPTARDQRDWYRQGPPHQPIQHPPNSWFYVPLLLAGARRLHPATSEAWSNHPIASPHWGALVQSLQQASPIPWQHIVHILTTLQHIATTNHQQLPPIEASLPERLTRAGSREPSGTLVHLSWVLDQVIQPDGYIPATAQETLLQAYLGERGASATATLADRWRERPQAPQLSHEAAPPPEAQTAQPSHHPLHPERNAANDSPPEPSGSDTSSNDTTSSTSSDSSSDETEDANQTVPEDATNARPSHTHHHPEPHHTTPGPEQTDGRSHIQAQWTDHRLRTALSSLDDIDLPATLQTRCAFFQTPPQFIRGRVRQALTLALECITTATNDANAVRAWKLWLLLPRMLLHRKPGTRSLPKTDWRHRIQQFQQGDWLQLLQQANHTNTTSNNTNNPHDDHTNTTSNNTNHPRDDTAGADQTRRAERARYLVHLGELSAARQALTAGPLAPGTQQTLDELRDPVRRPQEEYGPLAPEVMAFEPDRPADIPITMILRNLRRARKGAAPGPSGLTTDTLRLLLDDETSTAQLGQVTQLLAQARVPPTIATAIALGRLVALQKPNGRVRGIVVGDTLRRLVSRCMAQQYATTFQAACQPHQYALSTRAGTEAIVHTLTTLSQTNPNHTILSVDGIGAFDNISRNSMLQELLQLPTANRCIPFVRMFYGQQSQFVWHDTQGHAHVITQAEGGEQGDPLMPALFALGQRPALREVQRQLAPNEYLMAFLDDIYVAVTPQRVRPVYDLLATHLHHHARIHLNQGKTRVWNAAGAEPPNIASLGPDVWVGNPNLPATHQGLTVLGAPVGSSMFVQHQLQHTLHTHQQLLQRIPTLDDLQASWLLLLFCASPRSTYLLRMCAPDSTKDFAEAHDTAIGACLQSLLQTTDIPATSLAIAHLPLTQGGLGLMSATILAAPAYWSSWADTLPVLQAHLPELTHQILEQLNTHSQAPPALQAAADAARTIAATGWEPPTWAAIASSQTQAPAPPPAPAEGPFARGWQHKASTTAHARLKAELFNAIPPASQALVTSQSGPFASRAFTTIPYTNDFAYPSHLFRILLLRRLRLPLPLFARTCRCRRTFDSLGDHRAACAQSGVLRSRGGPLERAAARVCREAGARVTTHTRLADLNVQHVQHIDDRRIEVIANGLALWGGAQLAVDATLVSPLTRAGEPRRRAGRFAGAALTDARKAKERAYPELLHNSRCRLVVLGIEVGGRWSEEAASFITSLARTKTRDTPAPLRHAAATSLISRWTAFLTHAAMTAFAASLLFEDPTHHHNLDGEPPSLSDLLAQLPPDPTHPSRLPPHPP